MVIITGPPEAQFKVSAEGPLSPAGPGHRAACLWSPRAFWLAAAASGRVEASLEAQPPFPPAADGLRLALSYASRLPPLLGAPFPALPWKVGCLSVPRSGGTSWSTAESAMALRRGVSGSFGDDSINMGYWGNSVAWCVHCFLFVFAFFPPLGK